MIHLIIILVCILVSHSKDSLGYQAKQLIHSGNITIQCEEQQIITYNIPSHNEGYFTLISYIGSSSMSTLTSKNKRYIKSKGNEVSLTIKCSQYSFTRLFYKQVRIIENRIDLIKLEPYSQTTLSIISDTKYLSIYPQQNTHIKIIRYSGHPKIKINRCASKDLQRCIYELEYNYLDNLILKDQEYFLIQYCSNCVYILSITNNSEKYVELTLLYLANQTLQSNQPISIEIKNSQHTYINAFIHKNNNQPSNLIHDLHFQLYHGIPQIQVYDRNQNMKLLPYTLSQNQFIITTIANQCHGTQLYPNICNITLDIGRKNGLKKYVKALLTGNSPFQLHDGLPMTFPLNKPLTLTYQNPNQQATDLHIIGHSSVLSHIKLTIQNHNKQVIAVWKPKIKGIYNSASASISLIQSQSYKVIVQSSSVGVQIQNSSQKEGSKQSISDLTFMMIARQVINLKAHMQFPCLATFRTTNYYKFQAPNEDIQILLRKCSSAKLSVVVADQSQDIIKHQNKHNIEDYYYIINHKITGNVVYIKVECSNYVFYTIEVRKNNGEKLTQPNIEYYLAEDDEGSQEALLMEFELPCFNQNCFGSQGYKENSLDDNQDLEEFHFQFIQAKKHNIVNMEVNCPANRFRSGDDLPDFQVTKIKPKKTEKKGILTATLPFSRHDYVGLRVRSQGQHIGYRTSDTSGLKFSRDYRWQIYHFGIFLILGIFLVYVLYMSLKKSRVIKSGGYYSIKKNENDD